MKWFSYIAVATCVALPSLAQDSVGFGNAHDRSAPIDIEADSLDVNQGTGEAYLKGNVVIVQDILRLSANEVEIKYTDETGTREITKMIAIGDVVIVSGEDAAEGDHAIYDLETSEIEMTGDVVLTQIDNVIAGQFLVVDLTTGTGTMTGRVRTTFGSAGE